MLLPFKLTVREYAICCQRSEETIRRQIRNDEIEAEGPPYLIHPNQLTKYLVDAPLAVLRLNAEGLLPEKYHYLLSAREPADLLPGLLVPNPIQPMREHVRA